MRFLSLFFLIGYLLLMVIWMGRTPAFNSNLRVQTANGDWILADTSAMYDEADYLFDVGYTFVFPDVRDIIDFETFEVVVDLPLPSAEELRSSAVLGAQHLEQSLAIAPTDARVWVTLAWARALAGETSEQVLAALRQSWKFASFDRGLAERRLSLLALTIEQDPEFEGSLAQADMDAVLADKTTLTRFEPQTLSRIADGSETTLFLQ